MALNQLNPADISSVARGKINAGLAAIDAEAATRGGADTALGGRIDAEAKARGDGDAAVSAKVDAEAATRGGADTALGGRIDAEAKARGDGDAAVSAKVDAEAATRGGADTALGGRIDAEIKARGDGDAAVSAKVDAEAATRGGADTALGGRIDAEAKARGDGDAAVSAKVDAEAATRGGADTALGGRIDAEAKARGDGDAAVSAKVDAEAATRGGADTALGGRIDAEAKARGDGDAAVSAKVDAEAATRGGADTALGGQLDDEVDARRADVAALRLLGLAAARPGDVPAAFITDPSLLASVLSSNVGPAATATGRVMRISGAGVLAPVALRPIEAGRLVKVRAVVRRYVDTRDPAGDAIGLFLAWYGADRAMLAIPTQVAIALLTVARGPLQLGALVSPDIGDASTLRPPAEAAYLRPFVQTWGDTPTTDVEVLETADVTDFGGVSLDLDAVVNRLATVEAAQAAVPGQVRRRSFVRAMMYGG